MLGEHAEANAVAAAVSQTPLQTPVKPKLGIPVDFPSWTLNSLSVRAFNALYLLERKTKAEQQLVDWDSYFYPLDAILGWNKIYGRLGFVQFQCVIPLKHAEQGLSELLDAIASAGAGSFLAVLKRFGAQEE